MILLLLITGLISIILSIKVFNKDMLFGFMFAFLQIYIYIPFAARVYDNDLVSIVSHISINDNRTITSYLLFCYLFIIILYVCFKFLSKRHEVNYYGLVIRKKFKRHLFLYNVIQIIIGSYLWINYLKYFDVMSYHDQSIVKSNIIWCLLLEYSFVILLIDYFVFIKNKSKISKVITILGGLFIISATLLTLAGIGNRGIAMPAMVGFLYLIMEKRGIKINLRNIKKLALPILFIFIIIAGSQFVRVNRGIHTDAFNFNINYIWSFFDIGVFLFQDYTVPGNSLMYCIEKEIIDPIFVIWSNFGNGIFFLNSPTIAGEISSHIAGNVVFGVGGFLPVEGYYLAGWYGCIIIPIIIVAFYSFYYKHLFVRNDEQFNRFMGFLLCTFLSMNVVRGQTYFLFKVLYMYIIPSVILYLMAIGCTNIKDHCCPLKMWTVNKS